MPSGDVIPVLWYGATDKKGAAFLGERSGCVELLQALSSPISGILGNNFDRTSIVSFGCFLWGVMTAAVGMCNSLSQVIIHSLSLQNTLYNVSFLIALHLQQQSCPLHILRARCPRLSPPCLKWALQAQDMSFIILVICIYLASCQAFQVSERVMHGVFGSQNRRCCTRLQTAWDWRWSFPACSPS